MSPAPRAEVELTTAEADVSVHEPLALDFERWWRGEGLRSLCAETSPARRREEIAHSTVRAVGERSIAA